MIGERMLRRSMRMPSEVTILGRGQLVADEQLVGDALHLVRVEQDVAAPPFLEFEETRRFGVDLGVEIVVLGPEVLAG